MAPIFLHELKEELEQKSSKELADIFFHCYYDWARTWLMWQDFKNLFTDNERIELLNKCGSAFFKAVYDSFHDSIIQSLTRLTDPQISGQGKNKYKNMSMQQFKKSLATKNNNMIIDQLITKLVCKTKFARKIRDKQISHTDFKTILGEIKKPDPAKIDEINEALDAAQAIFAYVIQSVLKKDDIIEPDYVGADAMWTLNMLYRGDEAFKEEIRTAEPTCPPEWVLKRVD